MPRPKPPYEMMNVCIRVPVHIVKKMREKGITELSQVTVDYWKTLIEEPEDPRMKTIQTIISEYVQQDPGIVTLYKRDDLKGERLIKEHLNNKGITEVTSSDIGEVMVRLGKVKG